MTNTISKSSNKILNNSSQKSLKSQSTNKYFKNKELKHTFNSIL